MGSLSLPLLAFVLFFAYCKCMDDFKYEYKVVDYYRKECNSQLGADSNDDNINTCVIHSLSARIIELQTERNEALKQVQTQKLEDAGVVRDICETVKIRGAQASEDVPVYEGDCYLNSTTCECTMAHTSATSSPLTVKPTTASDAAGTNVKPQDSDQTTVVSEPPASSSLPTSSSSIEASSSSFYSAVRNTSPTSSAVTSLPNSTSTSIIAVPTVIPSSDVDNTNNTATPTKPTPANESPTPTKPTSTEPADTPPNAAADVTSDVSIQTSGDDGTQGHGIFLLMAGVLLLAGVALAYVAYQRRQQIKDLISGKTHHVHKKSHGRKAGRYTALPQTLHDTVLHQD